MTELCKALVCGYHKYTFLDTHNPASVVRSGIVFSLYAGESSFFAFAAMPFALASISLMRFS